MGKDQEENENLNRPNDELSTDSKELLRRFLEHQESCDSDEGPNQTELQGFEDEFMKVASRLHRDLFDDIEDEEEDDDEHPGEVGDFRIIRKIGSGGMATVYEAEQISLKRRVALKILPPHLRFSDTAVAKFQKEAEVAGRQRHHAVVSIYAVGHEKGVHYIAQELVESGQTMADLLTAFGKEKELFQGYFREIAKLFLQAADALSHAHGSGVVHRDVKPSNMLITAEGFIKITDFGLAKVVDELSKSRTRDSAGTPYYMAPEQISGRKEYQDHRIDVFSLGAALYESLTLKRPFEGESTQEVLKKICNQEPQHPKKVNPRVPEDLSIICLKALEKKPSERYSTMDEFADDLRRFLSGDVIRAVPAGPLKRLEKKIRRNPKMSIAIGVATVAVMLFIGSIPWNMARLANERDRARHAESLVREQKALVEKQYRDLVRLKDTRLLTHIKNKADALWPAFPENIPDMQAWIKEAEKLCKRLDTHRETLTELEKRMQMEEDSSRHNHILNFDDSTLGWQHELMAELVAEIEALGHEKTGRIKSMQDRIAFAGIIHQESIDKERENWDNTIARIEDAGRHHIYKGLKISPQLGLVPIGQDPDSGLFEFAHLQTGNVPDRDPDGKIIFKGDTGLIFVLIPGGTFMMGAEPPSKENKMGAPNVDPMAFHDEGPVHEVTIKPFFMSKYEMSQGQWLKFTGTNPSLWQVTGKDEFYNPLPEGEKRLLPCNPVEFVNWDECTRILGQMDLRLPTEAEWEYAARAGTTTVWWTGNDRESLIGAGNFRDLCYLRHTQQDDSFDTWLDDGFWWHAPVYRFKPNPFGLHNVCGNVSEWCQDWYHDNYEGAPTDGSPRSETLFTYNRMSRGGSWHMKAQYSRSASRHSLYIPDRGGAFGVRPAMTIQTNR